VKTGYGRLFFRQGKGFSASLKLLSTDTRTQAGVGHLNISLPLRESIALVRSFCGVFCAPAAKIDIPYGRDVWLMLFTPMHNSPSVGVSKPMLTTDKASIQASLSVVDGELRYSLSAYGSDFRKAGLELVRRMDTGTSLTHGFERVTVREKLVEIRAGESIQSTWKPSKGSQEPILAIMRSIPYSLLPYQNDVIALLQALGCNAHNTPLLGPSITPTPFTVGDGGPTEYKIRLTINGKTVDEAEVKVSFGR
jgi:hypothetical protein